jgi:hypothetical protein
MKRALVLLLPVIAHLSACISPAPPTAKSVPPVTPSGSAPAMVTQNPDGTITVIKGTSGENTGSSEVKNGLVIPAQIITPIAEKKQDGTSPSESR